MYGRRPNRGNKPAKKAGTAAGILVLLALVLCLVTGCAGREQKTVTSLDQLSVFVGSDIIHVEDLLMIGLLHPPRCKPILQEDPLSIQLFRFTVVPSSGIT